LIRGFLLEQALQQTTTRADGDNAVLKYSNHIIGLVLFVMLLLTFRHDPSMLVITILAYPFLYIRFIGYDIYAAIDRLDDNLQWRDIPGLLCGYVTRRMKGATGHLSHLRTFVYGLFHFNHIEFVPRIESARTHQIWALQLATAISGLFVCVEFGASQSFRWASLLPYVCSTFIVNVAVIYGSYYEKLRPRFWLLFTWTGSLIVCLSLLLAAISVIDNTHWDDKTFPAAMFIGGTLCILMFSLFLHPGVTIPLWAIFFVAMQNGSFDNNIRIAFIFVLLLLSLLAIYTTVTSLHRRTIPWVQLMIGMTVVPFFISWTMASLYCSLIKPYLAGAGGELYDRDSLARNLSVRAGWASNAGWQKNGRTPLTIAVTLSGGGYRAAVIHAGLLAALDEHCVPVRYLSVVSGGSIFGGYYAVGHAPKDFVEILQKKRPGLPDEFLAIWNTLTNWVGAKNTADVYAQHFRTAFFGNLMLSDTTDYPKLLVNATDVERTGDAREVFFKGRSEKYPSLDRTSIGDLVAASGAFPGVFQPKTIIWPSGEDDKMPSKRRFIDGGVFENLGYTGIERFLDIQRRGGIGIVRPDYTVISDASAEGATGPLNKKVSLLDLVLRSQDISFNFQESLIRELSSVKDAKGILNSSLFIRAQDAVMKQKLKDQWFPNADTPGRIAGEQVAEEVSTYSTLQELSRKQIQKAYWLGRTMGEIGWSELDKVRRAYTDKPSCAP
jgi:hypothetical protein